MSGLSEISSFLPLLLGTAILVITAWNMAKHEINTGAVLIAVIGLALVLSPKLRSFAFGEARLEFFETTTAIAAKLTDSVDTLTRSVADVSSRQAALASAVQRAAAGGPAAAAEAAQLGPLAAESRQLSDTLANDSASQVRDLRGLQQDLAASVRRLKEDR
jgi:hypothetical protein